MEDPAGATAAWLHPWLHNVDRSVFDLDEALTFAVGDQALPLPVTATPAPAMELPAAEEVEVDSVCSICTEGFRKGEEMDGKRAPCGHVYHSACISTWICRCNSCPLCRAPVVN